MKTFACDLFELEDVDPIISIRLTLAQLRQRFIPIDQIPDPGLDPYQELVIKEEGTPEVKQKTDPRDIARPESYLVGENNTFTASTSAFNDWRESLSADDLVDLLEQALLRQKRLEKSRMHLRDSHGKRGRKPVYKDKTYPHLCW